MFGLAGLGAICVYPFVPTGLAQDVVYVGLGLSGVVAIVVGIRLNRPIRNSPWYLMAAGQFLWVLGDAISSWLTDVRHIDTFPSMSDVFYLVAYPVIAAGLVLMIRGRRSTRDIAGLLDSATVTAGLGLLSWVLLARPTIANSDQSALAGIVGIAYPIADILLIGLLIRLITTPGGRTVAFRLLLGAVLLLVAGDTTSSALSLFTSSSTNAYDTIWLGSYVAWGVAALHPSMYSLSEPTADIGARFSRIRLAALTIATLVAPGVLAAQSFAHASLDVWAVATGSVIMFLLVVIRMNVAIEQIATVNYERARLQDDLEYQAAHDSLTGLPNRAQALRLIDAALSRAQRTGAMVGLLFIDLDGFKAVNDTAGHRAGDELLRVVAQRIQSEIRAGDTAARLGGDEFVVLLEPLDAETSAIDVADRLVSSVSAPVTMQDHTQVHVGASIGVAISQDAMVDSEVLLHEADVAVYRAKAGGRGRTEVYDSRLRGELTERAETEQAIAHAIEHDELVLYYQPIIDAVTEEVAGYEALVRWDRPGVGLLPPAQFIHIAEASDLICDLDAWVLRRATRQLAEWNAADPGSTLRMSVNISARHITRPRVRTDVLAAISEAQIAPNQLVLEITETVVTGSTLAIAHLSDLRGAGVIISMDDFGTGYNSISRLNTLPVDIVKIDRQFLENTDNGYSPELLKLLVQAAHAFGLPVVAEGVEYNHQLAELRTLRCEAVQGFLLGRPMTLADTERHRAATPHSTPNSLDRASS